MITLLTKLLTIKKARIMKTYQIIYAYGRRFSGDNKSNRDIKAESKERAVEIFKKEYLYEKIYSVFEKNINGNNGTFAEQVKFQEEIQRAGINLVSCCSCGCIFMHRIGGENIICPSCKAEGDPSIFGDMYYNGMDLANTENNQ